MILKYHKGAVYNEINDDWKTEHYLLSKICFDIENISWQLSGNSSAKRPEMILPEKQKKRIKQNNNSKIIRTSKISKDDLDWL